MKKICYGVLFLGEGVFGYLLLCSKISFPCLFQLIFKIPCPGCGMTRAFRALMQFHLGEACSYHIFSIPFFLLLVFFHFLLIYDCFQKTHLFEIMIAKVFRPWFVWMGILFLTEFINLYSYFGS